MKPEEILAAKAVLDTATSIRSSEYDKFAKEMEPEEFIALNPIENFIAKALIPLKTISEMMQAS